MSTERIWSFLRMVQRRFLLRMAVQPVVVAITATPEVVQTVECRASVYCTRHHLKRSVKQRIWHWTGFCGLSSYRHCPDIQWHLGINYSEQLTTAQKMWPMWWSCCMNYREQFYSGSRIIAVYQGTSWQIGKPKRLQQWIQPLGQSKSACLISVIKQTVLVHKTHGRL